ncbi:MAG: serine hydrolase [Pyrinomonadaceae bacterium]
MRTFSAIVLIFSVMFTGFAQQAKVTSAKADPAAELIGLWRAKHRFGPDVRGTLILEKGGGKWKAQISGRTVSASVSEKGISFELPGEKGSFEGSFENGKTRVKGFWIQPATVSNGTPYASPVELLKTGENVWRGEVIPLEDELTLYLSVARRSDGVVGAFLRNPERNLGRFIRIDRLEREGDAVKLVGADSGGQKGRVWAEGIVYGDVLTVFLRGTTFDFRRVEPERTSDFYPRPVPEKYVYAKPPALDDGWETATLEEVGIDRGKIEKFIQMMIDTPIESVSSSEIHGILIARRGRLVLEEYFHGEHREKPHDTRSASKSVTATLVGAAIQKGLPVKAADSVYSVVNGGSFPEDLPADKRRLTLENLLTMSSGLDCDDGDSDSPGNEDVMQEQTEQPDWYKYTLDLKMIRRPGEKAVYCSGGANLIGDVVARGTGRSLPELFGNLLAEPLQIKRFYMNLTPTGDAYMGGGIRFLPRDFMKFGQLHLDGGKWKGRQIISKDWAEKATSPLYELRDYKYGYLWWVTDYPYKNRTVRAFFAGGNGGQVVIGIPELDLVIAFWGGNYSDPALFIPQRVFVPEQILPAVGENK